LDPRNDTLAETIDSRPALLVTDRNVYALFGQQLRRYVSTLGKTIEVYPVDLGERTKTMSVVLDICAAAHRHRIGRRDPLIAFGGGICADVVAVAASLIRRGLPHIAIPTTLVAHVDG